MNSNDINELPIVEDRDPKSRASISSCSSDPLAFRFEAAGSSSRPDSLCDDAESFFDSSARTSLCGSDSDGSDEVGSCSVTSATSSRSGFRSKRLADVEVQDIEDYVEGKPPARRLVRRLTNENTNEAADDDAEGRMVETAQTVDAPCDHLGNPLPADESALGPIDYTPVASKAISTTPFAIIEAVIPRSSTVVAHHTIKGCVLDCGSRICLANGVVVGRIATLLGPVADCSYAIVGSPGEFAELLMSSGKKTLNNNEMKMGDGMPENSIQKKIIEFLNDQEEVVETAHERGGDSVTQTPDIKSKETRSESVSSKDSLPPIQQNDNIDPDEQRRGWLVATPLAIGTQLHYDTENSIVIYDPRSVVKCGNGTDASTVEDKELPPHAMPDFDDDAEEINWKRERRQARAQLLAAKAEKLSENEQTSSTDTESEAEFDESGAMVKYISREEKKRLYTLKHELDAPQVTSEAERDGESESDTGVKVLSADFNYRNKRRRLEINEETSSRRGYGYTDDRNIQRQADDMHSFEPADFCRSAIVSAQHSDYCTRVEEKRRDNIGARVALQDKQVAAFVGYADEEDYDCQIYSSSRPQRVVHQSHKHLATSDPQQYSQKCGDRCERGMRALSHRELHGYHYPEPQWPEDINPPPPPPRQQLEMRRQYHQYPQQSPPPGYSQNYRERPSYTSDSGAPRYYSNAHHGSSYRQHDSYRVPPAFGQQYRPGGQYHRVMHNTQQNSHFSSQSDYCYEPVRDVENYYATPPPPPPPPRASERQKPQDEEMYYTVPPNARPLPPDAFVKRGRGMRKEIDKTNRV